MFKVFIFILFFLSVLVENAYAYLDFGTGSYVLQMLFASFIGFVVVMKNHLEWVKQLFKKKKDVNDGVDDEIDKKEEAIDP